MNTDFVNSWIVTLVGGAIVVLFFEVFLYLKQKWIHKKYVKALGKTISERFSKIYSTKDFEGPSGPISRIDMQFKMYEALLEMVNIKITTNLQKLKDSENEDLLYFVIFDLKKIHSMEKINRGFLDEFYTDAYNRFKELKWLKLKDLKNEL